MVHSESELLYRVHLKVSQFVMLLPPGIENSGNICFASAVLHCLLNQKLFREVVEDVEQSHLPECRECKQSEIVNKYYILAE